MAGYRRSRDRLANRELEADLTLDLGADLKIVLALIGVGGMIAWWGAHHIGPDLLSFETYGDTWFDSDVAAYYATLSDPQNPELHERTYKHPLLSAAFCLPVMALQQLHVPTLVAVRLLIAAIAALWLGSLYLCLRLMGCPKLESVLLGMLGSLSAAGLFWLSVLESFGLGSVGILWAVALVAIAEHPLANGSGPSKQARRAMPWGLGVGVSVLTLSVTITNWMAGLLATALVYGRRRFFAVQAGAIALLLGLVAIQHGLFASALPLDVPAKELRYVASAEAGSPLNVVAALVSHTLVMPAIGVIAHPRTGAAMMTVQFSSPGSGSVFGAIAVGLWLGLLALGLWQLGRMKQQPRLRLMLALTLLGQLGLHLVYTGRESFLYSLHFLPLWLAIVALGVKAVPRRLCLPVLVALLLASSINNLQQLDRARAFYPPNLPVEPIGAVHGGITD